MAEFSFTFSCPGCCGDAGRFQWECRSRSGTVDLCGWPEFIPSTPPRYYLDGAYGGSASVERWGGTDTYCGFGEEYSTWNITGSGTKRWSAAACTMSDTSSQRVVMHIEGGPAAGDYDLTCGTHPTGLSWAPENCSSLYGLWVESTSRTIQRSQAWPVPVVTTPLPHCGCNDVTEVNCSSGLTISLVNEDTEQAAISRATSVTEWTEWGFGGCCTVAEPRTGRTVTFSQAQFRIRVAGTPGVPINLVLTFSRSSKPAYTETRQYIPQGEEFGEWVVDDVPMETGQSTCLVGVELYNP